LGLYDPDRSRTVINRGEVRTWGSMLSALQLAIGPLRTGNGAGLRLLTEPISSPTLIEQIETLLAAIPGARWHQWDAVYGTVQGGAPAATALCRFDRADVIVAL